MRMQRTLMVLVPVLVLAACGGALVSDPAAVPSKYPTYGVRPENLEVEPRKSPVQAGEQIPMLLLEDQKGFTVSTREVSTGSDALLIFQGGWTSPEARPVYDWVRENRTMTAGRDCEILLIGPDTPDTNAKIAAEEELKIAMLHDPSGWGARAFGLLNGNDATHVDGIWSVVLGREGRILAVERGLYDISDLITLLAARPDPRQYRATDMLFRN